MNSPFIIDGPAVISFSGGRTSGYMLRRILDEGLRPDVHVLFADTGKERGETYAFVRECAARWGVSIEWVARSAAEGVSPFEQLIRDRGCLPNPIQRFCTQELKIRPIGRWMRARGFEHWTMVVGIRADEPRRVAKMRQPQRERWEIALPLADAEISERDVMAFWASQPFDLQLQPWEGNCDLCFLKSAAKRARIAKDHPEFVAWWAEQEQAIGDRFRRDGPGYAQLLESVRAQRTLFEEEADALADCICHEGTAP